MERYKLVNFCEFDPYAVKSYCAIHGVDEKLNLGDINLVDENKLEYFNSICGGSPCTSFSVAGNRKGSEWVCQECGHKYNPIVVHHSQRSCCPVCGGTKLDKTQSSLLIEYMRVIKANKPDFGVFENVKNIVNQFRETFDMFEKELQEYGYNTYWKVMNARDYGVPQNRERLILVFIKKEKDNGNFVFPDGFELPIKVRDLLEPKVDMKYYLSKLVQNRFKITDKELKKDVIGTTKPDFRTVGQRDLVYQTDGVMGCLTATDYKQPKQILIENNELLDGLKPLKESEEIAEIYNIKEIANARKMLDIIIENNEIPEGLSGVDYTINKPKIKEIANCITARYDCGVSKLQSQGTAVIEKKGKHFYVRKLTPKECFRLMGFSDDAFEKARKVNSDTQLYKQAGNSIVVDVLYYTYKALYEAMPYLFEDMKLGSYFSGIGAFETALERLYKEIEDRD